jgi:diguanylate cyclase (GGDEF)-like protein/PAS domain S-box-containing protein
MGALSPDADEEVVRVALLDHRLHKALLDQTDEGVCMVNRDHRIVYWNGGAERISGYLAHEVAGQFSHGDLFLHGENDGSVIASGPGSLETGAMLDGKAHENTVFLMHREGYRLLVKLQSRPIHDAGGGIVGTVEVFEEIAVPLQHRARELEEFGCQDSSSRAANRKYGEMTLRHSLEALHLFEIPFGWLRIGLDLAQDLHRNFGEAMIEAAVRMIASALDRSLGSLDVLTRWENTEFRVEVNQCSRSQLAAIAERLRLLVRASSVEWWGDRLRVTISVGGATAERGDSIEALEERVGQVYEGCRAGGGDRAAVAHWHGSGAERCSP